MRPVVVLIPLLAGLSAGAALAAEDTQRYQLEQTDNGYVRMDKQTGEMSICEERSGQLVCKLAVDERTAFQDEVERLQSDLKAMDRRIFKLENSLAARVESSLPTEEEFNKTMGYMERFFRSFMGIINEHDKDKATGTPAPSPDKT